MPCERILKDVLNLGVQILRRPKHMIERFGLPHSARSHQGPVDPVCRCTLDRFHDCRQRKHFHRFEIDQWSEDEMNVIRNYDHKFEVIPLLVVVQAGIKNNRPHSFWKGLSSIGIERHEVRLVVDL